MPHLASITYGPFDQMASADLGGGGDAYYQYDASGQRVRKLIDTGANLIKERIYLGAYEVYREPISGGVDLERQSLHVMDGTRRVALLETLTIEDGDPVTTPVTHQRFQLGNHLDSALLEVDEAGMVVSYEELLPYGASAYRSARSDVDVSPRRYRYTGKERDDETGLYYYGARYYACWLGRWTSADPLGIGADGPGLYNYTRGSPVVLVDPSGTDSVDEQAALSAAHQQLAGQEYHRYLAEQYVRHEAAVEGEQAIEAALKEAAAAATSEVTGTFPAINVGEGGAGPVSLLSGQEGAGSTMDETLALGARTEADPIGYVIAAGVAGAAVAAASYGAAIGATFDVGTLGTTKSDSDDESMAGVPWLPTGVATRASPIVAPDVSTTSFQDAWTASTSSGGALRNAYWGERIRVPNPDPAADALAKRLGGESRFKFAADPLGHEFDAISNVYIGQTRDAGAAMGRRFRNQAKATFEASLASGRMPYFHFQSTPHPTVLRKLREYEDRYGLPAAFDFIPLP
ncbi:MAG: hypothetical protein IPG04_37935 [Polyangiaceae bacterium]|nr:hypothetical protein [Polyangiaceae bacterium]